MPLSPRHNKLKIAILVTDGFEQSELEEPRYALEDAGAQAFVVSPKSGTVKAWDVSNWGDEVLVDHPLDKTSPDDYDALVLPGGVQNPDCLRQDPKAVEFVRAFVRAGKPVGAICHAPWTLVEADAVRGRALTSYPSLKTDLCNAGAKWVDREVVVDGNLVTSRTPHDLPAFTSALIDVLAALPDERHVRSA